MNVDGCVGGYAECGVVVADKRRDMFCCFLPQRTCQQDGSYMIVNMKKNEYPM